jgi:hypothetical protein
MPVWLIILIVVSVAWHVQATRLLIREELEENPHHYKTHASLVGDILLTIIIFPLSWMFAVMSILEGAGGDPNILAAKIAQPRRVRKAAERERVTRELEKSTGIDA